MSDKPCIMKIGDYITRQDVVELTDEQWDKFRTYLKECGYTINSTFGNKSAFAPHAICIVLDDDGDLTWRPCFVKTTNRITKKLVLEAIRNQCCVMNNGDYIRGDIVAALSQHEWSAFRSYLRKCGYSVSSKYGLLPPPVNSSTTIVELQGGDLVWCPRTSSSIGREIRLSEIYRVIEAEEYNEKFSSMNEIKNKIKFHESEIGKLNSLINENYLEISNNLNVISKALKYPDKTIHVIDSKDTLIGIKKIVDDLGLHDVDVDFDYSTVRLRPKPVL